MEFELPTMQFSWLSQLNWAEFIIYGLLSISILFSLTCMLLSVFHRIRYSIPTKVNCWFCNENWKISYSQKNGWTCRSCQQYNGFTKDGNYNKRIPSQYIESLNRPIKGAPAEGYNFKMYSTISLCSQCNLNQELKNFQLASFVPSNEDLFDQEIEKEQKRLEAIYDLCAPCKLLVKNVINNFTRVKANKPPQKSSEITEESRPERLNAPILPILINNYSGPSNSLRSGDRLRCDIDLPNYHTVSDNDEHTAEEDSYKKLMKLQISTSANQGHLPSNESGKLRSKAYEPAPMPVQNFQQFSSYSTPPSPPLSVTPPCLPQQLNFNCKNDYPSLWQKQNYYPMMNNRYGGHNERFYSPCYNNINYSSSMRFHGPSLFHSPLYEFRSSSMATVFGGRKPLVSPSKLSLRASPPRQNSNFTTFGGYGVYYGADIMLPSSQYGLPVSRSSSQSSGFVSQDQYGSPTHSGFSTAPNSEYNSKVSPSSSFCSEHFGCKNFPINQSPPAYLNTVNFYEASPRSSPIQFGELTSRDPGRIFGQNNHYLSKQDNQSNGKNSTKNYFTSVDSKRKYEVNQGPPASDDDQIFSDDEDNNSSSLQTTARTSSTCLKRRIKFPKRTQGTSRKVDFNDINDMHSVPKKMSRFKIVRNALSIVSLRFLFEMFLRLFLFVNVMLLFCMFFVGKWPEPLAYYISMITRFYENAIDYCLVIGPNWMLSQLEIFGHLGSNLESENEFVDSFDIFNEM